MSIIGVAFLISENAFAIIGAVVLIGLGVWFLLRGFARKEASGDA
jgi:putative Mn2+ efflux pump MntP